MTAGFSGEQGDVPGRDIEEFRDEPEKGFIGLAVHRRGLEADLERIAMQPLHMVARRARSGVDVDDHAAVGLCNPTHSLRIHEIPRPGRAGKRA